MIRIGSVVAVAVTLLLVDGATSLAAPPIDQSQPDTSGGTVGFCDASVGETFIANVSGTLTHLAVAVNRSTIGDPGDLLFRIRSVDDDGLPTARILGTATAANASIPVGDTAWLLLAVDPTPKVTAGRWYAITTDAPDCDQPGDSGFGWAIADGDRYPRGTGLYATTADGPWTRESGWDFAFRTHVKRSSPVFQPDLLLAPLGSGPWVGGNQYDRDGWTERIEQSVIPGEQRTYRIRIQNDGTRRDTFVIRGTRSDAVLRIRYLKGPDATVNLTRSVTGDGYRVGPLDPGSSRTFRVQLTVRSTVEPGVNPSVTVVATSRARATHRDALRIRLIVE